MANLINRKESTRYPGLFVKKYDRKVFYKNLWNTDPELLESRGHVEDKDGNVVIRPFTKIFNMGENGINIHRDEYCLAIQKINGFMASATYVPSVGEVVISTTGSLDSDFVGYAEKYITPSVKNKIVDYYNASKKNLTYIFEICHPDDPHIIYENEGAYLIGVRNVDDTSPYFSTSDHELYLDQMAEYFDVFRPFWFCTKFDEIVKLANSTCTEGFVVYGQDSKTALKIKSKYYLCLKAAARKKDIMSLDKEKVDEEFYDLIDFIKWMGDEFTKLEEQDRLLVMKNYLESSRKSKII